MSGLNIFAIVIAAVSYIGGYLLFDWIRKYFNHDRSKWAQLEGEQPDVEIPTVEQMLSSDDALSRGREVISSVGFDNDSTHTTDARRTVYSEIFVTRTDGGVQTLERTSRSEAFDIGRQERAKALAERLGVEYVEL